MGGGESCAVSPAMTYVDNSTNNLALLGVGYIFIARNRREQPFPGLWRSEVVSKEGGDSVHRIAV